MREVTAWDRLKTNRNWLSIWFMLPAAAFLILFLAYPLGLGVWLSFTDARIGRDGIFVGIENYEWLWDDSTFWLSVFNTLLYTSVASTIKFAVGLYLALLLNESLPFKAIIRAVVLIPVHRADGAFGHRVLVAVRSAILDHLVVAQENGPDHGQYRFPRRRLECALVGDLRQYLARRAICRDHAAGRPADGVALALRGRDHRRRDDTGSASAYITYPLLTPIIAVVMTFSVLFTFTDFQLIWVMTRGGPVNATHLMATFSYQRAIMSGHLGEGAAISTAMIPFLLAAILVSWFGLQRRKWQQGESND